MSNFVSYAKSSNDVDWCSDHHKQSARHIDLLTLSTKRPLNISSVFNNPNQNVFFQSSCACVVPPRRVVWKLGCRRRVSHWRLSTHIVSGDSWWYRTNTLETPTVSLWFRMIGWNAGWWQIELGHFIIAWIAAWTPAHRFCMHYRPSWGPAQKKLSTRTHIGWRFVFYLKGVFICQLVQLVSYVAVILGQIFDKTLFSIIDSLGE